MRCPVVLAGSILCLLFSSALLAQGETPEARQLQTQLEDIQRRLDQIRVREGANQNVTEIGSSRARTRSDGEPRLVVRIYDLADLYSIAPSYPAREGTNFPEAARFVFPEVKGAGGGHTGAVGGMGGMGGGMFSIPTIPSRDPFKDTLAQAAGGGTVSDAARTSVESLIETITSTISPDEWDQVGGPATIKVLGASLVVSAPTHIHDKIAALIDLFRKRWRSLRTISLEAHWLWLTARELQSVPLAAQDNGPFGVLTDAAWTKLRDLADGHQERNGFHAVVTCYNGQTVHTVAGSEQLLVTGVVPMFVNKETPLVYRPTTTMIQDGIALQVTPIATRTAKFVVADIHSRVNLPSGPAERLSHGDDRALAANDVRQQVDSLDRPMLQSHRLSTTVRIPVGRPMLVGGMTMGLSAAGEPNLYLFITPRVQELRDDETEAAPTPE